MRGRIERQAEQLVASPAVRRQARGWGVGRPDELIEALAGYSSSVARDYQRRDEVINALLAAGSPLAHEFLIVGLFSHVMYASKVAVRQAPQELRHLIQQDVFLESISVFAQTLRKTSPTTKVSVGYRILSRYQRDLRRVVKRIIDTANTEELRPPSTAVEASHDDFVLMTAATTPGDDLGCLVEWVVQVADASQADAELVVLNRALGVRPCDVPDWGKLRHRRDKVEAALRRNAPAAV